jgi:hypothetical protein
MTTALSLILALMLSIGGSSAGGPGNTGIQATVDNSPNTSHFFEGYTPKTASSPIPKKILEIVSIEQPKTQTRLIFTLPLKEKPYLRGYIDSMNLYQAFNMNPVNFTDPFGTIITKEDLYKLKRIKESQGPGAAKSWIDRNPNFTSGEQLDLHMKVIFGFKDPDEFSVLDYWIASTTYDIGKPFGLESYLKFHAGVKYRQPNLQIEGLAEIGERGLMFGLFSHYVPIGVEKLADKYPWFQKALDFLGKPIGQLFKPGGNVANTGATTATAGGTSYLESQVLKDLSQVSDDTLVHVTTDKGAEAILKGGLNPEISGYVTKWKYVKDITDPKVFNTKLYSQSIWKTTTSKFNKGAYILRITPPLNPKYFSPFTNRINGVPQWLFQGKTIDPSRIELIKIIPGGS